jgi:hypothetical protein
MRFEIADPEQMNQLGLKIAATLQPGDLVLLNLHLTMMMMAPCEWHAVLVTCE